MTNQEILRNAPDGATHYVLHNGASYYFKIKGLSAGIWTSKGWDDYEDECCLPDLEDCRNIEDIKRIVELENELKT